jgi:hypothetical protein
VNFYFKMSCKIHFSCIFQGVSTCSHVANTAQQLKGRVSKKKFALSIGSWIFTFFQNKFAQDSTYCHFQYDYFQLNVNSLIFSKRFYKFQKVGILS